MWIPRCITCNDYVGDRFQFVVRWEPRGEKYRGSLGAEWDFIIFVNFYSHFAVKARVVRVIVNGEPVMAQLVRIYKGVVHILAKVQSFMED